MNKKGGKKDDEPRIAVKNAADLQRLKIEKLMKNPDKEVMIPDRSKEKKIPTAPEFIRNVMGSSAGAGSGEFHVYRHLRRKEYARQKFIQKQKEQNRLDDEYLQKIKENQQAIDEKTAKKRAKRQKNKEKQKAAKKRKQQEQKNSPKVSEEDESDNEEEEEETKNKEEHDKNEEKFEDGGENIEKN